MNYTQVNKSLSSVKVFNTQIQQFSDVLCFVISHKKTISFWKTSQNISSVPIYIEQTTNKLSKTLSHHNIDCSKVILKECLSNFYHASSQTSIIVINLDESYIVFIDEGRGIIDINKALTVGYSTTGIEDRKTIRGLGLGFSIIKRECKSQNITFILDSLPNRGTKVHLILNKRELNEEKKEDISSRPIAELNDIIDTPHYCLTKRQREVLNMVDTVGEVGPSIISELLGIPLSTAFRDLNLLEKLGLISSVNKKRIITTCGLKVLQG